MSRLTASLSAAALCACALPTASAPLPPPAILADGPLGVFFPPPLLPAVATALQVNTIRDGVNVGGKKEAEEEARTTREAQSFRVVISYYNTCGSGPCRVTNDTAYVDALKEALASSSPTYVVIQNEENDPGRVFTIAQYEHQLALSIPVAHAAHLPIANGGLTSASVALAYWESLWFSGQHAQADAFATVEFAPGMTPYGDLRPHLPSSSAPGRPILAHEATAAKALANTQALLTYYRTASLDAVNIHLYNIRAQFMGPLVAWVQSTTGHPVICNEMGVSTWYVPTTIDQLDAALATPLGYIIWFASDGTGSGHAAGLANSQGILRPAGLAFAIVAAGL